MPLPSVSLQKQKMQDGRAKGCRTAEQKLNKKCETARAKVKQKTKGGRAEKCKMVEQKKCTMVEQKSKKCAMVEQEFNKNARWSSKKMYGGQADPRQADLVACPLAGGASSWLGWVTVRRRGEGHESDRPHRTGRTERAPSAGLLGCVCACVAAGLDLEPGGGDNPRPRVYFQQAGFITPQVLLTGATPLLSWLRAG
jgi:hypothetical protein